jgi:Ca-activated chloride channel family protein
MKKVIIKALLRWGCVFLLMLVFLNVLIYSIPGRVIDLIEAEMLSSSGGATIDRAAIEHALGLERPWYQQIYPFSVQSSGSYNSSSSFSSPAASSSSGSSYSSTNSVAPATIGLSTGGSKDINNFRDNIRNNYLPLPTSITYEGLFYDYYFDTGSTSVCNKLFCPSYSYAVTRDPISHQSEYYLSVGLNSGLREENFQRKKLNLVIVLDRSYSMDGYFDEYFYDGRGNRVNAYASEEFKQLKIKCATKAVVSILEQLKPDDRFAIVLFDEEATLVKPMGLVSQTDMEAVENDVLSVMAEDTTNLMSGIDLATAQFRNLSELSSYEYENRIIALTDAQPNTGDYTASGLSSAIKQNASRRIYTTFIGIGVDFNNELIELITKIRGANYYSVHSPREFRNRVEEEFDYMVTPLVFNVQMSFESSGWRIQQVFGSPEADRATGKLMRINTLFPSKSEGGETKGGLVLLKLQKISSKPGSDQVYLKVTYENRNGVVDSSQSMISLEQTSPEYFDNTGIRKGILLTRYAALLKNWMIDERMHLRYDKPWDPCVRRETGIVIPEESNSDWEQTSLPLNVSRPYRVLFNDFSRYFESEMNAIGDYSLDQELALLHSLAGK